MSVERARNKYRDFFHKQNYTDNLYTQKSYNYFKKLRVLLNEGDFQKIYLQRKSFDIKNEVF